MEDKEQRKNGRDEMNIAEFPITALTKKKNTKPIVCQDEIEVHGQKIKRKWTLSGDLILGTPIATDEETIMFFQKYLYDLNYQSDTICYTTWEFLKLTNWPIKEDSYLRHAFSLLRLHRASITAEYAFWDNDRKVLVPILEGFHIIEDFKIYSKTALGRPDLDAHIWDNSFNMVRLSKRFIESAKIYSTQIDLQYYFSLEKPISKRLFRFLNKWFYNTDTLCFDIRKLCYNHLGLVGEYNIAQLKRELDKAHEELLTKPYKNNKPFLQVARYENENVAYIKMPEALEFSPPCFQKEDAKSLVMYFHNACGHKCVEITQNELKHARKLIKDYGFEKAKFIVDYAISEIKETKKEAKTFGYVLTYLNDALLELKEKEQRDKVKKQQQLKEQQVIKEYKQQQETFNRYIKYFNTLPPSRRDELTQQAVEDLRKQGVKEEYMSQTLIELQIVEILKKEGVKV